MLTPRGRTVVAMSVGMLGVGRALALRELQMLGAALAVLLLIAIGTILARRVSLSAARGVTRARGPAGSEIGIHLTVTNRGPLAGGPLLLEDKIPASVSPPARLALESVGPRTQKRLSYTISPKRRGVYTIGPLELALTDPFGLVLRRTTLRGEATVVVYPPFEAIRTLPRDVQRAGVVRRSPLLGQGDEFYGLRAYEEGDDPRKVHWATSMRLGEPIVKQEELLQEPGALVVLDTCGSRHRGEGPSSSLEAAISACASVAVRAVEAGMALQVLTADGTVMRVRRPNVDDVLEALARLEASAQPDMTSALVRPGLRRASPTAVIVITPGLQMRELALLHEITSRAAGGMCVRLHADSFGGAAQQGRAGSMDDLGRLGLPIVDLRARESFATVWESGVRGVALAR